jgi:hypothetical protein
MERMSGSATKWMSGSAISDNATDSGPEADRPPLPAATVWVAQTARAFPYTASWPCTTASAGNRRFWPLSALYAHKKTAIENRFTVENAEVA